MTEQTGGDARRRVLNVGGNNHEIALPAHFNGWQHLLLDIDPAGQPDIVCDARELQRLDGATMDAVHCAHNLEHYHRHEVRRVLAGFLHVLKPDGFCEIRVPDIGEVMRQSVARGLDIDDTLYESGAGPITVRDVIYGWGAEVERSGNDFYCHKTGFTPKAMIRVLTEAGFGTVYCGSGNLEVRAIAFVAKPTPFHLQLLGIAPPPES